MIGVFTNDTHPSDQHLFVCESTAFASLCEGLVQPCICHWMSPKWEIASTVQVYKVHVQLLVHVLLCYDTERSCTEGSVCVHQVPETNKTVV